MSSLFWKTAELKKNSSHAAVYLSHSRECVYILLLSAQDELCLPVTAVTHRLCLCLLLLPHVLQTAWADMRDDEDDSSLFNNVNNVTLSSLILSSKTIKEKKNDMTQSDVISHHECVFGSR